MKIKLLATGFLILALIVGTSGVRAIEPVNPKASPEAKALLELFYRISGKYTLTGQHNYPSTKDENTRFAKKYIGKTPVIWSSDMGFAKDGDKDSYLSRPDIVKEAIKQHQKGSIITLCWHAVPPTADEPITFQTQGPAVPGKLASVQGKMLEEQYQEVLTPGTRLHNRWAAQVDSIAVYLKKLQAANVPVLWRPYHEMNGDWFWWGCRVGKNSTIDLYRQLYDRLVNFHKLNNLIWVWNIDRPGTPIRKFSNFYVGNQFLDIASLDVYGSDFNQAYYDSLKVLAKGKPILFGEVGNPPSMDVFVHQPDWASWVIWAGMVRNTTKKQYQELVNNPRMLSQEDAAYWEVANPYRKACGLPLLPLKSKCSVNFSGNWVFNEEKSDFGKNGTGNVPYSIEIDQDGDLLHVKRMVTEEFGDDQSIKEDILLDGTEMKSMFMNSPRVSTAEWNPDSKSVKINSSVKFTRNGQTSERKSSEEWMLQESNKFLKIVQTSSGSRDGETTVTLVYEKK
jgi:mannan endo-1,4-beta-mannosidase